MTAEATPFVETRNLTFGYHGRPPVLQAADFLLRNERVGLVGHNGSGKTTLLHCIMGLLRPQSGDILFKGVSIRTEKDFVALRRGIGFVFQSADDQLFLPTVLEDVSFGPLNLGKSPKEAKEAAYAALDRLNLADFAKRITHRLSGGEKKLVSLATVLAMEPEVLFLDEPTNELDPPTRERLLEILRTLDQPLCIVSHDWPFLDAIADRLCVIEKGRLSPLQRDALRANGFASGCLTTQA